MAFVQAFSNITNTTQANLAVTVTLTAGNMAVLFWGIEGAPTLSSLTSSHGSDNVTTAGSTLAAGGSDTAGCIYISSVVGGATTFTLTPTGNTNMFLTGAEFSGRNGTIEQLGSIFGTGFVQNHSGGSSAGGPATAGSLLANDDIFVGVWDATNPSATESFSSPASGFTFPAAGTQIGTAGVSFPGACAYAQNVAAGSQTFTYVTAKFVTSAGFIIGLPAGNQIVASYGPFAITGSAATLTASTAIANLLAFPGTYNVTGAPASSDYNITATVGSYLYAGQAVQLVPVISPVFMTAATGSYSIEAENVRFSIGIAPPPPSPTPPGPILPVVFKVTTRQFNLLEMVEREWGASFREPDHRVYVFGGGKRSFDSTDTGFTGIYGPAPVMAEDDE